MCKAGQPLRAVQAKTPANSGPSAANLEFRHFGWILCSKNFKAY
jgi:hypothetical protein